MRNLLRKREVWDFTACRRANMNASPPTGLERCFTLLHTVNPKPDTCRQGHHRCRKALHAVAGAHQYGSKDGGGDWWMGSRQSERPARHLAQVRFDKMTSLGPTIQGLGFPTPGAGEI